MNKLEKNVDRFLSGVFISKYLLFTLFNSAAVTMAIIARTQKMVNAYSEIIEIFYFHITIFALLFSIKKKLKFLHHSLFMFGRAKK